ncbi:cupin domain-containing protein [Longimicrobium sp.]|uniref:cupin domain-containing protein n=1 Tax=Longimicrobium sp. TaxID=2029185 RepID=UPI002E3016F8|nr:cupin domain-containing protein [Longimicrobium sp.]HEX6038805.1 cupin domain-containing protein [Longimicrobium sp.]
MSSINRPLAGPVLAFDLAEQIAALQAEEPYRRSGRAGRTLAKSGRFRLVLTAMAEGNDIGTHQADSPMTLQVVKGALTFRAAGEEYRLSAGQVLFFGPGEAHDIRAAEESALLLTLSAIGDDYRPEEILEAQGSGVQ